MNEIQYYVIDLETTGLKSNFQEATEISIIRASDKVQISRMIKCKHPERASWDALKITKKTLADLSKGDDLEKVIEECDDFFNQDGSSPEFRCIVGHNIYTFDRKFLHAMWGSVGKIFPANMYLDTIPMTRAYGKSLGMKKFLVNLHAACDLVGVKKLSEAHSAKMDSRNSYLLWKGLTEDKKMDFLPFIKNAAHVTNEEESGLDPDLLD